MCSMLLPLCRSRPLTDGTRGVSHPFRDHAGLGHPWKGVYDDGADSHAMRYTPPCHEGRSCAMRQSRRAMRHDTSAQDYEEGSWSVWMPRHKRAARTRPVLSSCTVYGPHQKSARASTTCDWQRPPCMPAGQCGFDGQQGFCTRVPLRAVCRHPLA